MYYNCLGIVCVSSVHSVCTSVVFSYIPYHGPTLPLSVSMVAMELLLCLKPSGTSSHFSHS